MKKSYLIVGGAVVFGLVTLAGFVVIVAVVGISMFTDFAGTGFFSHEAMDYPPILDEPGVHHEDIPFRKAEEFASHKSSTITDIQTGQFLQKKTRIVIVSSDSAYFTDLAWNAVHTVRFDRNYDDPELVRLPGGGFGFMNRGAGGDNPAWLDTNGKQVWKYGGFSVMSGMAVGDLDQDGQLDFVLEDGGNIRRLDARGNRVWRKRASHMFQVAIADTDGNGSHRILHTDMRGTFSVRNAFGDKVGQLQPPGYITFFSLCAWPDSGSIRYPLYAQPNSMILLDYGNGIVNQFETPDCGDIVQPLGTPVRFMPGQPSYFAGVANYYLEDAAILYICNAIGALVYQEVFANSVKAIAAIPEPNGTGEYLALGMTNTVICYRLASEDSAETDKSARTSVNAPDI